MPGLLGFRTPLSAEAALEGVGAQSGYPVTALHSGSKFTGHQQSKGNKYEVEVEFKVCACVCARIGWVTRDGCIYCCCLACRHGQFYCLWLFKNSWTHRGKNCRPLPYIYRNCQNIRK